MTLLHRIILWCISRVFVGQLHDSYGRVAGKAYGVLKKFVPGRPILRRCCVVPHWRLLLQYSQPEPLSQLIHRCHGLSHKVDIVVTSFPPFFTESLEISLAAHTKRSPKNAKTRTTLLPSQFRSYYLSFCELAGSTENPVAFIITVHFFIVQFVLKVARNVFDVRAATP